MKETEMQYMTAEVQRLNEIIHKAYNALSDYCADCRHHRCNNCKLFKAEIQLGNERFNGGSWHERRRAQEQKKHSTVRTTIIDGTKIEYWLFEKDAKDLTDDDKDKLIPSVYHSNDGHIYTEYDCHGWWQKIE